MYPSIRFAAPAHRVHQTAHRQSAPRSPHHNPNSNVFMRNDHAIGLAHRRRNRIPVVRVQRPQIEKLHFDSLLPLRLLRRLQCAWHHAPYVTSVKSVPGRTIFALPNGIANSGPGYAARPYVSRYSRLCSRNNTGSSHRIAVRNNPFASSAFEGNTTRNPGVCVKMLSPDCE